MSFAVTILGSSSAKPTPDRHPSAQAVNIHEQYYLVDAGRRRAAAARPLRHQPAEAPRRIHLAPARRSRLRALPADLDPRGSTAPDAARRLRPRPPSAEILESHLRYFDTELPYEVLWHEVRTTEHALLYENRTLEVWSIPLRHRVPCAGFLFREKEPPLNVDKFQIVKYGLSIAQITAAKRGEAVRLDDGTELENGMLTYRPYAPRSYAYLSDTNFSAKAAELCGASI